MNRLVAMESPIKAVAIAVPSMKSVFCSPAARRKARCIAAVSKSMSGLTTKAAVGAREHQAGPARGDANRVQIVGPRRETYVAHHRAVLLRQPGEIQHRAALALKVRRHADQRADRHHAGAA